MDFSKGMKKFQLNPTFPPTPGPPAPPSVYQPVIPNPHAVSGGLTVSRPAHLVTADAHVNYQHIPTGSGASVGVSHTQSLGTNVGATGTVNVFDDGNSRLDASASYGRHYGGPMGTQKPQMGGKLSFKRNL